MIARKLCPLMKKPPSSNCFCVEVNSQKIPGLLEYCANNFSDCYLYKTYVKKNTQVKRISAW
ncbi:MAG: hypothetical protein FJ264_10515 [Planctomycetes bacterium]|nr:hypothetical protein [Planctomycetota bacterium]